MARSNEPPSKRTPELTPEKCRTFALEAIARYQELAVGLSEARALLYPGEGRKSDRKLAFLHGVASAIQFLQGTKYFLDQGLEEPLTELLYELQTVASGLPSMDFAVKPGKRGRGIRHQAFQMNCALLLESYMAASLRVEEASARVVRLMKTNISPRTIEDWRTDLCNVNIKGEAGERFRSLKREFARVRLPVQDIDVWASRLQLKFADLQTSAQKNAVRDKRIKAKK